MNGFVLPNTKEDILNNAFLFLTMEANGALKQPGYLNIFLCVWQNKLIHAGLELLEDELMMTGFSFLGVLSL